MRRVDSGSVDADKLIWFDEILEDLEANKIGVTQARERLEAAASALAPYSPGLTAMVCGFACASLSYWVAESRTLLQPRIFCCHSTQTHTTTYLGSAAPFLTDYGARSIFHSLPLERDPR